MKTQSMTVGDFLTGAYKEKKKINWKPIKKVVSTIVPLTFIPHITFAQESVPVGATQYLGEKTLETIAHALDSLVDLMVALSFPVCSVYHCWRLFFLYVRKK